MAKAPKKDAKKMPDKMMKPSKKADAKMVGKKLPMDKAKGKKGC